MLTEGEQRGLSSFLLAHRARRGTEISNRAPLAAFASKNNKMAVEAPNTRVYVGNLAW